MVATRRAIRLNRQKHDDGDDDDTVWHVRPLTWAISYHDDPDCPWINNPEKKDDETRAGAQAKWLAPCQYCVVGRRPEDWDEPGD